MNRQARPTTPPRPWRRRLLQTWSLGILLFVTLCAYGALRLAGRLAQRVESQPQSPAQLATLMHAARSAAKRAPAYRWGEPMRNAHFTNTAPQMLEALRGDANFLEGDLFPSGILGWGEGSSDEAPVIGVMRHTFLAHQGMLFSEWLAVATASLRGIKIDIKNSAAVPAVVREVRRLLGTRLDEGRLMFNADVVMGPGGDTWLMRLANLFTTGELRRIPVPVADLLWLRHEFPAAVISIGAFSMGSAQPTPYTPDQIERMIAVAQRIGGAIGFPLRAEFVDAQSVATLLPHGVVSVWNNPLSYLPDDLEAERARLRVMGVNGAIDLRREYEVELPPLDTLDAGLFRADLNRVGVDKSGTAPHSQSLKPLPRERQ